MVKHILMYNTLPVYYYYYFCITGLWSSCSLLSLHKEIIIFPRILVLLLETTFKVRYPQDSSVRLIVFLGGTSCSQHPVWWGLVSPPQGQVSLWPPRCPAAGPASPLGWSWSSAGSPEQSRKKNACSAGGCFSYNNDFNQTRPLCLRFTRAPEGLFFQAYRFTLRTWQTLWNQLQNYFLFTLYPTRPFANIIIIFLINGCDMSESAVEHILGWKMVILIYLNSKTFFYSIVNRIKGN